MFSIFSKKNPDFFQPCTEGVEGVGTGEGVFPLPSRLGSVVSSPSGVRGETPAEIEFCKI